MKKYFAALLAAFCLTIEAKAEPSGAAFLKIPNGAAEISLGMSGVSHSQGGSAAYWNPARIGIGGSGLGLQFFRWLGDGRGMFGTASFKTKWGGIGAYVFDLSMDGFEARDRPGPADATFTLHQSVAAVGASYDFGGGLRTGAALKGFVEDIYGDVEAEAPLIDAGISWENDHWTAGVMGANLLVNDRMNFPPPLTGRIGLSRKDFFGDYSLMDVAEMSFVKGFTGSGHVGIEAGYVEKFFLRCGAALSGQSVRPTFGVGLNAGSYRIDGALALYDEALGSAWRVGLGYKL